MARRVSPSLFLQDQGQGMSSCNCRGKLKANEEHFVVHTKRACGLISRYTIKPVAPCLQEMGVLLFRLGARGPLYHHEIQIQMALEKAFGSVDKARGVITSLRNALNGVVSQAQV